MGRIELDDDGQLKGIRDYLASAKYSQQIQTDIQKETEAARKANVEQMPFVIAGLEKINNFWNKRVVYGFRENSQRKSDDLAIINVPIIDRDLGGVVNIKYVVATRVGIGHIKYNFDHCEPSNGNEGNINLYSPVSKIHIKTQCDSRDMTKAYAIKSLSMLTWYFDLLKTFSTYLKVDDKPSALVEIMNRIDKSNVLISVDFSDSDNKEQIETDLQNIFGQLNAKQQELIDEENSKLQKAQASLAAANGVSNILQSSFEISSTEKAKRKGIFGGFKRKNKEL